MWNKYMRRGIGLLVSGVAFNLIGWFIKNRELGLYGWAMIIGTILFGIGFLLIFYSLVRKVERQAILEERAAEAEKLAKEEKNL
jgi:F0F1-type ATP synthase assembly protein I